MVDEHRAKDDICEAVDVFTFAQVVDKKFTQAATVGQTPAKHIDPGDDGFRIGFLYRAFTIKLSGVYRFPWDVRLGAIARYQDGQPFSRMLVFPELAQGAEAVRAFPAGDSRFRFIGTLDTRLTKGFALGSNHLDFILDVYNLPGLTYDVEERAAAAPNDRTPIAIQPSRIFHLGARVTF